jgi:hypothetical protein
MGEALKVLGQQAPPAATQTVLYTVPAVTQATCSTLVVCNQNNATVKVRVRVKVNNAADAASQFLLFDVPILKTSSEFYTLGLSLGAGDVVTCYSDTTLVAFNLFGVEIT